MLLKTCSWFCTTKCFTKEVYINTKYTKHLQLLLSMMLTNLGILKIQKLVNIGKKQKILNISSSPDRTPVDLGAL